MKCPLFVRQYAQVGILGIILAVSVFLNETISSALQSGTSAFAQASWFWDKQFEVSTLISFIGLLPIIVLFLTKYKKERFLFAYAIIWVSMIGLVFLNILLERLIPSYSIFSVVSTFYSVIGQIGIIGVMMLIFSKTNYTYYVKAGLFLSSLLVVTDQSFLPLIGKIIFVVSMIVLLYELFTHKYTKAG